MDAIAPKFFADSGAGLYQLDLKEQVCFQGQCFWLASFSRSLKHSLYAGQKALFSSKCFLNCVLCATGVRETTLHLFFQCPFSSECWAQFGVVWDLSLSFGEMLFAAKNSYMSSHFVEKVLYAAWNIWKQRNGFIFDKKKFLLCLLGGNS
jgi:hypothetical protein